MDELESTRTKQVDELTPLKRDLSVFNKLELSRPPVGVKFLWGRPEGIERLGKTLALCEMVTEAQKGTVFYADYENHECVGPYPLGMCDVDTFSWRGPIGPTSECLDHARANVQIYEQNPRLERGTCNYLVFAPLDKLTFDPDGLVFYGTQRQMEIIMRSMTWTTGQLYESKSSSVMGCAWTLVYPYLSQKINFQPRSFTFGHISRVVGEDGDIIVSVPWTALPTMVENLNAMNFVLPSYTTEFDNWGTPTDKKQ